MKKHLTLTDFLLIAINLIPLWGVWFRGWDARQMFLVYCCETIIIGLVNVLKMLIVIFFQKTKINYEGVKGKSDMPTGMLFILFFIIHYGFFVSIQLNLFLEISGMVNSISLFKIFFIIPHLLQPEGKLMLIVFASGYVIQAVYEYVLKGEYKTASPNRLLFEPYIRIFIQQFIVIIGSFFLHFGGSKIFIVVYVTCITFFNLVNYQRILKVAEIKEKRKMRDENSK